MLLSSNGWPRAGKGPLPFVENKTASAALLFLTKSRIHRAVNCSLKKFVNAFVECTYRLSLHLDQMAKGFSNTQRPFNTD